MKTNPNQQTTMSDTQDIPTAEEARLIAKRFIDGHFGNAGEKPRIFIPANPRRDDDIRLHAFIDHAEDVETELTAANDRIAELEAERVELWNKARDVEGSRLVDWATISELRAELARIAELEAERDRWAEMEAEVCPEDVGFPEHIKSLRSELARLKAENQIMGDTLMDIDQPASLRGYPPGTMARRALLKIKRLRGEVEIPGQIDFLKPAPAAVDGEGT